MHLTQSSIKLLLTNIQARQQPFLYLALSGIHAHTQTRQNRKLLDLSVLEALDTYRYCITPVDAFRRVTSFRIKCSTTNFLCLANKQSNKNSNRSRHTQLLEIGAILK